MDIRVGYKVRISDVDSVESNKILSMLATRKYALGIYEDYYYLYHIKEEENDVLRFTDDFLKDKEICEYISKVWYACTIRKFYATFTLDRYFNEEGIADTLDKIMGIANYFVGGRRIIPVLTMVYPNNLTIRVLSNR